MSTNAIARPPVCIACIKRALLRGRPIGRITRLARPSVRLSVCLNVCPVRARNSKRKNVERSKLVQTFPSKSSTSLQLKGQRSRSQDVKNTQNWRLVYFLHGRPIKRKRIRRRLQTRPTPLLCLIYCRRLNMRHSTTTDGRTSCGHSPAILSCYIPRSQYTSR